MVTKREVLGELTLPKLKKIARQLGIRIGKGVSGFLSEQVLGLELRGPYIETLANSPIVTLGEIDRVLGTNYSGTRAAQEPREMTERPTRRVRSPTPEEATPLSRQVTADRDDSIEYILGRFVYKEDAQAICEDLDLPVSGTKDDLIKRLLRDEDFTIEMALAYVDKEGLKAFCDELELPVGGTRDDLVNRILGVFEAEGSAAESAPAPPIAGPSRASPGPVHVPPTAGAAATTPRAPPRRELFAAQDISRGVPLELPEAPPLGLIPEPTAPLVGQLQMVAEFLESYRPSQRFRNEQAYEIEIAQAMRHHFGAENVKTQANIVGGRIDIEVLGIGVEIKVPASRGQLQTLLGQVSIYRNFYGPNLAVIVFNDFAKLQDVSEFSNILRGRGIHVFVK